MATIAKEAVDFAKRTEAIKTATVNYVYNLGQGLSRQELAVLIAEIDFTALVNELGYVSNVDKLLASYEGILKGLDPIAPLSEEVLQALAGTDKAFYLGKGEELAVSMKQALIKGAILGTPRSDMKKILTELSTLSTAQIRTLVDTSMRTFSRTVYQAMSEGLPADVLWIYEGPVDDKTRDICLQQASVGAITKAEIISTFGSSVLTDAGGFNCRHEWVIETDLSDKFTNPQGAAQRIDDKAS